jgi:FkbM family methyltransferase
MTPDPGAPYLEIHARPDVLVKFATRAPHAQNWFRRYLDGRLHEPVLTAHILDRLGPGNTFIDVGAHVGWFSVLAAARGARVLAFEMQAGLIPLINESISLNGYDERITVVPAGLGRQCGLIPYRRESLSASKGVSTTGGETDLYAPCLTLDVALAGTDFVPDLIKVDVQGFEGHFVDGARETLSAHRPALIMELHDAARDYEHSTAAVLSTLDAMGYEIEIFDSHRSDEQGRAALRPEQFSAVEDDSLVLANPR